MTPCLAVMVAIALGMFRIGWIFGEDKVRGELRKLNAQTPTTTTKE
jgi:hypothetical protein